MFSHRYIRWPWLIFCFGLLFYQCGSDTKKAKVVPVKISTDQLILNFFAKWKGIPYKLGGIDTSGIDCSALTRECYKEVFHLELPRRVVEQRVEGIQVSIDSLLPGDLIVFKGSLFGRPHIGIHITDMNFMHASSSKGVMISTLKDRYWRRKFKMARRMIDKHGKLILDPESKTEPNGKEKK